MTLFIFVCFFRRDVLSKDVGLFSAKWKLTLWVPSFWFCIDWPIWCWFSFRITLLTYSYQVFGKIWLSDTKAHGHRGLFQGDTICHCSRYEKNIYSNYMHQALLATLKTRDLNFEIWLIGLVAFKQETASRRKWGFLNSKESLFKHQGCKPYDQEQGKPGVETLQEQYHKW